MSQQYHPPRTQEPSLTVDLIKILLALFLPPIAVLMQVGLGAHFWLNILLTICGILPGSIHAVWVIMRR